MLVPDTYKLPATGAEFDLLHSPDPGDGRKYPTVLVLHGNLGLNGVFGDQLKKFTEEIAALGYAAALPAYYARGFSNLFDSDVFSKVGHVEAALASMAGKPWADTSRLAIVGFSLGGGVAAAYIQRNPGRVSAFVDYYGYVVNVLPGGVAGFPPTILFNNADDPSVKVKENAEPFADALAAAHVEHFPVAPYTWYGGHWERGFNHVFEPDGVDDRDSRKKTADWLTKHVPPVGLP